GRGDRRKLLALAQKNAASGFATRRNRQEDSDQALTALKQRLGLSRLPRVIECYDISHIQGSDTVASMVVFVDGAAARKRYRSFKIRGLDGLAQGTRQNDDFASMAEVLGRRLRRGLVQQGPQQQPMRQQHRQRQQGPGGNTRQALPRTHRTMVPPTGSTA
ncbi:MAG TPA: hypothetical protein PLO41_24525, partial [Rubrivivax sp.]|nr:hypothetical protein [Rubrivivax sp.]